MIEIIIGAMFAFVVLAIIIIMWIVGTYNSFIELKNSIENAWSQITVQLKKRFDLIPNLIATVKGYAKHEKETFKMVTEARNKLKVAKGIKQTAEASNLFTDALKSLFAVAEAYPELKADKNFLELQTEISAIESKIAYWREFYNNVVLSFNTQTEVFPSRIIAGIFKFFKKDYFDIPDAEKKPFKVSFD